MQPNYSAFEVNLARSIFGTTFAAEKAPVGGVEVQGTFYPGGQFIPAEVVAEATTEEKAEIEGEAPAGGQDEALGGDPAENKKKALQGFLSHNNALRPEYKMSPALVNHVERALEQGGEEMDKALTGILSHNEALTPEAKISPSLIRHVESAVQTESQRPEQPATDQPTEPEQQSEGPRESPNVNVLPSGEVKLTNPKTVDEANSMLAMMREIHAQAQADMEASQSLPPNSPDKVKADLKLNHVNNRLQRAILMAQPFTGNARMNLTDEQLDV